MKRSFIDARIDAMLALWPLWIEAVRKRVRWQGQNDGWHFDLLHFEVMIGWDAFGRGLFRPPSWLP